MPFLITKCVCDCVCVWVCSVSNGCTYDRCGHYPLAQSHPSALPPAWPPNARASLRGVSMSRCPLMKGAYMCVTSETFGSALGALLQCSMMYGSTKVCVIHCIIPCFSGFASEFASTKHWSVVKSLSMTRDLLQRGKQCLSKHFYELL